MNDEAQKKQINNASKDEQRTKIMNLAKDMGYIIMESTGSSKPTGAICQLCGQGMLAADGCTCEEVEVNGKRYERIRFGDEVFPMGENCCHDCGARPSHFHHLNCDAEECPVCGGQLIGCDCEIEFVTED